VGCRERGLILMNLNREGFGTWEPPQQLLEDNSQELVLQPTVRARTDLVGSGSRTAGRLGEALPTGWGAASCRPHLSIVLEGCLRQQRKESDVVGNVWVDREGCHCDSVVLGLKGVFSIHLSSWVPRTQQPEQPVLQLTVSRYHGHFEHYAYRNRCDTWLYLCLIKHYAMKT
jgi:hypothetical protein